MKKHMVKRHVLTEQECLMEECAEEQAKWRIKQGCYIHEKQSSRQHGEKGLFNHEICKTVTRISGVPLNNFTYPALFDRS